MKICHQAKIGLQKQEIKDYNPFLQIGDS